VWLKLLVKYKNQLASYQYVKRLFIFDYFLMKTVCLSHELSFIAVASGTQTDERAIHPLLKETLFTEHSVPAFNPKPVKLSSFSHLI